MTISYEIILTIINLINNQTKTFSKSFSFVIDDLKDELLYNNYHLISSRINMFALFKEEINDYCLRNSISVNNIDIDEFNINSLTDRVDVYFEPGDGDDPNQISLQPSIKCYVYPKYDALEIPELKGRAYDDTTIIWSWEDDGQAHYLISEAIDVEEVENLDKVIAQLPIGITNYTETNLEADTPYTRRLVSYNNEQTSNPSRPLTIRTATAPIDQSLEQYEIPKNYDYTSDDSEREVIQENLEAFHSGVGDYNDLKVYKQMDADFYQKFKAYIQLRGSRTQREKRYDSVGFNYKVCLESEETVEEQKGEVTFDVDVYPRENISIRDYVYATQDVTICARMECDVLLKKSNSGSAAITCDLKVPKWKKKTKTIENEENEEVVKEPKYSNPCINIVIDVTNSLRGTIGGISVLKSTIKNSLLDKINNKNENAKYTIVVFGAKSAVTRCKKSSYSTAVSVVDSLDYGCLGTDAYATSWSAGIRKMNSTIDSSYDNLLFFITDGGFNCTTATEDGGNGIVWWQSNGHYNPEVNATAYYNDLRNVSDKSLYKFSAILVYNLDGYTETSSPYANYSSTYLNTCADIIADDKKLSWDDQEDLSTHLHGLVKEIAVKEYTGKKYKLPDGTLTNKRYHDKDGNPTNVASYDEDGGWKFKGWKDSDEVVTLDSDYSIDDCKWAHVVIPPMDEDPWTVTINNTITPIIYARNEQRAIIPPESIIEDKNFDPDNIERQEAIKVDNRSIQAMILSEVRNTTEWRNGYNQIVQAHSNDEQAQGQYIIRGLFIKDTYKYSDDDVIPDVDLDDPDDLEDGYSGTINVYAEINKLDTTAVGDDVYAVGNDKYVWLSGYTDAIICDGERIASLELNASNLEPNHNNPLDHQTEILVSPDGDYTEYLWNRRNHDIQYSGEGDVYHVVSIIDKDKDIYITGTETLQKVGDWVLFVPEGVDPTNTEILISGTPFPVIEELTDDIIAHNDMHYNSPILNYRFSIEDPDAYTSYYEILPDCDPESEYKNIVFVHIYYARNIYIQDENRLSGQSVNYIASFGNDNIATRSSSYYLSSQEIEGQTYFRDEYIDDYVWFQAKPHYETRPYYDEKPNPGMDSFYGNVNGRYREDNKSGKQDLRVVTPQFNLPTTIDANNIKIYISISEFYPDSALVSYKWQNPLNGKDDITNHNGDYVTFRSDSLTYKDVIYNELLQTVTTENMELFDNKTTLEHFKLTKPLSRYTYDHYFIDVISGNSDVLALNYPSEVVFDENNNAEFGANFKGVVNATTKWSPRIHNGYYYLNQHEYYAYSEFDVEADFEEYNEENYKVINGYLTIDVDIMRKAGPSEHYDILKNTRSELTQNEKNFTWVNGKGLTILPKIDGKYYKEYTAYVYTSPVLLFNNVLTSAGKLKVNYTFEDGSTELPMKVRSYNIEQGNWSEWVDFTNDTVPNCDLSCAYQLQFTLTASVTNHDKTVEDYLCCYLDWKDDGETDSNVNCITITDSLQAGPYESDGIFNSKIIDFGCISTITLDIFESKINSECSIYIATENYNRDRLLLENISWTKINNGSSVTARFIRYRIVIPYGEKVYWLHKHTLTKESDVLLPYIQQIHMTGDFTPTDTYDSFQEVQSFEITTDGLPHRVFASIYDIISGDIRAKGFKDTEIQYVRIKSTENNITLNYNSDTQIEWPGVVVLNTPIYATADFETEISVKHTPYIFASMDPQKSMDVLEITKGTPQQYCPITMEDVNGVPYKEVFDVDPMTMLKTEEYVIQTEDDTHFIKLSRNDFDIKTFVLYLNDELFDKYQIVNNLIIFETNPKINDIIKIEYNILNSFYTEIDYNNDKTKMTIYSDYDSEMAKQGELQNLVPIVEHTTYTECKLNQMYGSGIRHIINKSFTTPDINWKYNAELDAIYYSQNIDEFSVIINNLIPVTVYNMTISVHSTDDDNDVIGFVAAYIKDAAGEIHTISYLISLSDDFIFNGGNIAIVYDYGKADAEILMSERILHDDYTNWNDMINGIAITVQKTSSYIECAFSEWNNPGVLNQDTILRLNLTSSDKLSAFLQTVYYGFCVQSQKDVYFSNPTFAARIDRTVTVEEQMNTLKHRYKVYFETNKTNNKFIASNLSLNPVYRTDYKGFIYLTDEHNEPYVINIYRNPMYIKAGGYDKIDVAIECLDYEGNPVISKDIDIDCKYGILNFDNTDAKHLTDINGVIHVLYESAVSTCEDILTARTTTTDGKIVEASVNIINE